MQFVNECWTCERVDRHEEAFQLQPPRGKAGYDPVSDQAAPDLASSASALGAPFGSSLLDKDHVLEFVKDFAKCGVRGVPCEAVDLETGLLYSTAYFLDPNLQKLSLRSPHPHDLRGCEFDLAHILEIGDLEGKSVPEVVGRAMAGHESLRDRLVALGLRDGVPEVFMAEGSAVDRDRFIMCVKILRLYAQTHGMGERDA